jgi:hypothetical protein
VVERIFGNDTSNVFDTGSANLWVPGVSCNDYGCQGKAKYNSKKYAKPESTPDSAPQPPPKNDLFDRLNIEQKINLDTGFDATIDVQPDFRFIVLALIFHVNKLYLTLEQKNRPLLTPPSLLAYCLYLVNGFFLVCDKYGRHAPSPHAREFLNDTDGNQVLETLLRSYIPSFLVDILRGLAPTVLPRRPGIEFVPTFAGFSFAHDFGRFFPPQIFSIAHSIAASTRSNADPDQILSSWFESPIVTAGNINIQVGHFLGAGISNSGRYENWFQSACIGVFNPVVLRSLSQRPTFQRLSYTAHDSPPTHVNPYVLNLNADSNNASSTIMFLESMSDLVKSDLTASYQLGGIFNVVSGINIVTHAYSDYSLPTWHLKPLGKHDVLKSPKDFAASICFMTSDIKDSKTSLPFPTDVSTILEKLYLVKNTPYDPSNDPDHLVLFDPRQHIHNPWRLFDPYDYLPSKFAFPIVCGLLIETLSVDGFTVPHPNLRSSLREENSQVFQSAVRLDDIRPATSENAHPVIRRTVTRDDKQKASISFYDLSRNRLPSFANTIADVLAPSNMYGFSVTGNLYRSKRMSSKAGYRVNGNASTLPEQFITAWSSYRYISPDTKRVDSNNAIDFKKVYHLLDFRTVFGTDVTLAQTEHGSKLIPSA